MPATATLHDASNFVGADYAPQTQAIFRAAAQRCRALITDSRSPSSSWRASSGFRRSDLVPIRARRRSAAAAGCRSALDVAALRPFVLYVGTRRAAQGLRHAARRDGARGSRDVRSSRWW